MGETPRAAGGVGGSTTEAIYLATKRPGYSLSPFHCITLDPLSRPKPRRAMRIKLHTLAPLPERKVLFPVNSAHTVAALAEQVCASVITPAISRGRPPRAHELVLEVDGFELLPNSSANVLEQNDVVTWVALSYVRCLTPAQCPSQARLQQETGNLPNS
jgi:hypothetical protein